MSNEFKQIISESGLPTEETEIRQQFERLTEKEGFITNTSRMSPFWRLISAIAILPVMWLIEQLTSVILPNLFVKTAKDKWLQIQAWSVGLDFKSATFAEGEIEFIKEDPASTITINQGTVVQTERINGVVYRLLVKNNFTIPRGEGSGFIPVIAEHQGSAFNLSEGYYCILPTAIAGIKKVVNHANWLTSPGAERETNEELRQRYRNQFASVGQHHIDSVYKGMIARVAGLSIDRIYFKHDAPRGPGTANAYLLLDTGVASQAFIDKVNNYVRDEGNHGHGDDLLCFAIPETQHNITCQIHFFPNTGLSEIRRNQIVQKVEAMIRCAFRENNSYAVTRTFPFSRFSWSRLGEEIHSAEPEIASLVWGQGDIVSNLNIPRLTTVRVTKGN